jgi:RNA polymerase sigma factor (sigma-70 family)
MNRAEDGSEVAEQKRKIFHERAPLYLDMLFAVVSRLTHDRELANEVAQQAIVKYLSQMENKNWQLEIENEGAYLIRIAKKLVRDGRRTQGKAEFMSLDQQLPDELLKHLSELSYTSDIENQVYLEELLQTLPWKTILRGFSPYHRQLLYLHAVESLSYEEIAQEVNKDVEVVRDRLQRIYAASRNRIQAIYGKRELLSSDTKRKRFHRRTAVKQFLIESETSAPGYEELNKLAGKEAPGLHRLVAEEAAARKYVMTRYQTLIDRKYERGLLASEKEELDGLRAALDKMDEPFYGTIIKQLRRLVKERGV